MFKNMKIEITDETHLKSICNVLESMGFKEEYRTDLIPQTVKIHSGGYFITLSLHIDECNNSFEKANLSDLLKMRDDMVKK